FVPRYVIDENPELATWEGYRDPEVAQMFATAETGDKGRFLGTDPSYSQYDEAIIENLGLPFQVVFSGSEPATVAELAARHAAQGPILMYWWTPTAAVAEYDLVNVTLPPYSDECYEVPEEIDCDYPEDVLFKAASALLEEKDPEVWQFLQNFTITTDDQLSMLPAVETEQREPAEGARERGAADRDVGRAGRPERSRRVGRPAPGPAHRPGSAPGRPRSAANLALSLCRVSAGVLDRHGDGGMTSRLDRIGHRAQVGP